MVDQPRRVGPRRVSRAREVGGRPLAVWSVTYTVIVINAVSYRQVVTPEPLLGRVNTAARML